MSTNGAIIQYTFTNNSFSNVLANRPSINSPYPGLSSLFCYDAGDNGYVLSIKPSSSNNQIKVQFKVKYLTSDVASINLKIGIVYTTNSGVSYNVVGQDTFSGSINAGYNVYMFSYMHSPNTSNNIVYKMFFQIENGGVEVPIGLIGDLSSSNCVILEEFMIN